MLDTIVADGHNEKASTKLRALLIASSRADAEAVASILNREGGFDAATVSHDVQVLSAIATLEPQIVVLSLPEVDAQSLSICQKIREAFNIAMVISSTAAH